jgi:hypothetical protein
MPSLLLRQTGTLRASGGARREERRGVPFALAVATFGGLLIATVLRLIVIPVLYELVEAGRARVRERIFTAGGDARNAGTEPVAVPGD